MTSTQTAAFAPSTSRRLLKLAMAGAISVAASGCAVQNIDKSIKDVDAKQRDAASYMREMQGRRPLAESRPSMRQMNSLWVDTTPQKMTNRSMGAPTTALDCKLTFNPKAPVTLTEFVRIISNLCGLTVQVTADATTFLNGGAGGGGGNAVSTGPMGELPPPNIGGTAGSAAKGGSGSVSNSVFSGSGDMISGISWVDKPLSGLLDLVTARLGLGVKFKDNVATIFYTDTLVFHLHTIPGKAKMETMVKSGAEKSSSSGKETSSFSADGSKQETEVSFETDMIDDVRKTLETMITPTVGRVSVGSTGTITVTDRPDVLARVKDYLEAENKRVTRQVLLNVRVLSVQVSDSDAFGVNWDAVYDTMRAKVGWSTDFASITNGGSGNAGIIKGDSRWNGTNLFIEALSQQGRVSTLASPSVTTLNLRPAPILVGTQTTYLAEVSTTAIEGGGSSQQSLTPGTITTGFNMTLLPHLMDGPEMLLQYSINLSALTGMKTAESGGNKIEMPEVDNRIFNQSVRMRSGDTMVLSGFDQSVVDGRKNGVGDSSFWLLGGGGDRNTKRDIIVVLITPIVTD